MGGLNVAAAVRGEHSVITMAAAQRGDDSYTANGGSNVTVRQRVSSAARLGAAPCWLHRTTFTSACWTTPFSDVMLAGAPHDPRRHYNTPGEAPHTPRGTTAPRGSRNTRGGILHPCNTTLGRTLTLMLLLSTQGVPESRMS